MNAVISHIEKIKYDMATLSKQNDVKWQSLNRLCQIIDDVKVQMGTSERSEAFSNRSEAFSGWHSTSQPTTHEYKTHE